MLKNKKGSTELLSEIVEFLPKALLFIALLFLLYGILDFWLSKRPTQASLDFDRVARDIEFLEEGETVRTPIAAKWYSSDVNEYTYRFYKAGKDKPNSNCPADISACVCLISTDSTECKSIKNVDWGADQLILNKKELQGKYFIEITKNDCKDKVCKVSLKLGA